MGRLQEGKQGNKTCEAKEEDWLRCRKKLQKSFLENRRAFWKKINGKEEGHRLKLGVESKDGILLTENEEVKNRWKEYFRELFNGEEREISTLREDEESEEEMPDEITEDEIKRSIWKLKSGKSSGVCGIQGELLKVKLQLSGYKKFIVWYGRQVWFQETGEELLLYLYIREEARNCVKNTGESAC